MTVCYLGLGGNLDDVIMTMDAALDQLDSHPQITVSRSSRVFETAPVGADAGGRFLNATAEVETALAAEPLLDALQGVEKSLGRTDGERWTERVLDLDLLLFGREVIDSPRLTVPHPHLWYRRFVLDPLVEIAEDVTHPLLSDSLGTLRSRLLNRPIEVALWGDEKPRQDVVAALETLQPVVTFRPVTDPTDSKQEAQSKAGAGIWLGFFDDTPDINWCRRKVDLSSLPGTLEEAAFSVMAAALDEPVVHNRPLRRIP